MRLWEWLFALSVLLLLILPLIRQSWRYHWLLICAALCMLVGGVHFVVEGWRVQMLPIYGLGLFLLVIRLPALLGREDSIRRGRGLILNGIGVVALVGAMFFAGWLLPVLKLPAPTGPYAVGIVDREVVDEARGRRLMLSIWYPASDSGTPAPLTHYPDEIANGLGRLAGLPGLPFQHLRYAQVAASENAPLITGDEPLPVLIFSHGMVGARLQSSPILQELASWGYVVVALDHTDAAAVTVFPDGEAHYYDLARFGITAADGEPTKSLMDDRVFPAWVADQQFVYDQVTQWAVDDPLLARRIDVTRIGSFGHSFGGATALEVCRVDSRCRAAVNLDGGLYGKLVDEPAVRPLLLMTSAESYQLEEPVAKWQQMMANAQGIAYWLELPGSNHYSFTIVPLLSPLLAPQGMDVRAGLATTENYVRAFFDESLRGIESPLLEPGIGVTDVRWVNQ